MTIDLSGVDLLVVGAGFYGATIAERAAERGLHILVIDRRNHIAGNAHSEVHAETGIDIHRYGPHFFHTSNEEVWAYVNRFSAFTPFQLRVWSAHRGEFFPMPINLATMSQFFRRQLTPAEARDLIAGQAADLGGRQPANLEEKAIASIGRPLYEALIRGYTQKQWQTDPTELPASIIGRLPVRYTLDTRYFSDRFQALPSAGYTRLVAAMLDHPGISVMLKVDWHDIKSSVLPGLPVVYTGPIDQYFDYAEGPLGWRTTDFSIETVATGDFQGTVMMNYPDPEIPFTRIVEYRHLYPDRDYPADRTVIAREYPRFAGTSDEPFYPIDTPSDRVRYQRYKARAEAEPGVLFGGRLGTYAYLDMHQAIAMALRDWRNLSPRLIRRD